jgi:hypothetical protein
MLAIGIVLLVLSFVGGIGLFVGGTAVIMRPLVNSDLVAADGSEYATLEADTDYGIFVPSSDTRGGSFTVTCFVYSPSGDVIITDGTMVGNTVQWSDEEFGLGLTFTSEEAGRYTFECADWTASQDIYQTDRDILVAKIPAWRLGLVLMIVGALIGTIFFIVGLILLIVALVKRSRARRAAMPPAFYYPGYAGSPGYPAAYPGAPPGYPASPAPGTYYPGAPPSGPTYPGSPGGTPPPPAAN